MIGNILITSVGRRVSLVHNAQETLKKYHSGGKVFACDMNPSLSSACHISDGHLRVPRVSDDSYLDILLNYCREQRVSIVIPTIDTELSILAGAKEAFWKEGIRIAISSEEICDTFYLKDTTQDFFETHGLPVPAIVNDLEAAVYPLFAKLNNSSCSVGAQKVDNKAVARELLEKDARYVFQEFIDGDEYTCDLFIDSRGKAVSVVPRQRLEVRAGEVNKAWARKDPQVMDAILQLAPKLQGAYGTITVQLFKRGDSIYFIEINPRFGGGYPLSWKAGADFMDFLIRDFLGEPLAYTDSWRDNTLMLRYDAEVIVEDFKG